MLQARTMKPILIAAALAATVYAGLGWATSGSGTSSTLLGRGTFDSAFKVERELDQPNQEWEVEVEAKPNLLDVAEIIGELATDAGQIGVGGQLHLGEPRNARSDQEPVAVEVEPGGDAERGSVRGAGRYGGRVQFLRLARAAA